MRKIIGLAHNFRWPNLSTPCEGTPPFDPNPGGGNIFRFRVRPVSFESFFIAGTPSQGKVLDQDVRVACLEDIIRGKTWSWQDTVRRLSKREKDRLDLIRIGETHPEQIALLPLAIQTLLKPLSYLAARSGLKPKGK